MIGDDKVVDFEAINTLYTSITKSGKTLDEENQKFVSFVGDKLTKYGKESYLSLRQMDKLKRISNQFKNDSGSLGG